MKQKVRQQLNKNCTAFSADHDPENYPENELLFCPNCNIKSVQIWVHGHYQCANCKAVVISCCDGESDFQM